MRILIVDDEEINRYVLSAFMKKKCLPVDLEFADNGRNAVNMFQMALEDDAPYNLVIMDYRMPLMNGDDAVRNIRELERHTHGERHRCTICISSDEQSCLDVFREWIDNDQNFCTLPKPVDFKQLESIYSSITRFSYP